MALINCEECRKEVSDKAASCPNCGAPLQVAVAKQSLWDSISQKSGPKEVVVRGTDPAYEGRKFGESIVMMFLALFLHPLFSFVGFWLLCMIALFHLAPLIGLSTKWYNSPDWYPFASAAIAVVPTVLFRKHVPAIMKWILIVGGSALVIWGVVDLASSIRSR